MKMIYRLAIVLMALAVLAMATSTLRAGAGSCDRCGDEGGRKVCRLVCDEKELEVNCWDSKREKFCVPGHCKLGCKHSTPACGDCGSGCTDGSCDAKCDSCGSGGGSGRGLGAKKFVWRDTIPGCAKIFTQKKLLKKVEKKKVKTYKWVLEDLCGKCRDGCDSAVVPEGTPVPPVPEEAKAEDVTLLPVPTTPISAGARSRLTDDSSEPPAHQSLSDLPRP
jgi:hypothetical protein